jgi:HK97 family phage major capsid protein
LQSAFARRLGTIMNLHFTTGTGSGQPNGAVTAATAFTTGVAVSALTRDNIVDLIHSVNPAYRANGTLMFNDTTLAALKKLSFGSSDDRPLWQVSVREGEPDRLEGFRYIINQDMASVGVSTKSVLFGDFSQYFIRLAGPATTLRLNERYAEYLHTGFLAYQRADGELLSANAIKALTHPAS